MTIAAAAAAKSNQSCPTLCDPHRLKPTRLLCPWDSPGPSLPSGPAGFPEGARRQSLPGKRSCHQRRPQAEAVSCDPVAEEFRDSQREHPPQQSPQGGDPELSEGREDSRGAVLSPQALLRKPHRGSTAWTLTGGPRARERGARASGSNTALPHCFRGPLVQFSRKAWSRPHRLPVRSPPAYRQAVTDCICRCVERTQASQAALLVKNPPARFDLGPGRPPGGGKGSPLQCSCLENPMDRGAWRLQSTGAQRVGHD